MILGRYFFGHDDRDPAILARWGWQALQGDQHATARRIRAANPDAQLLVYAAPLCTRGSDPDGITTALRPADVRDEWLLTDSNGEPITGWQPDDRMLDLAHPDYLAAATEFLVTKCRRDGWDGVMLDEINRVPTYAYSAYPAQYPDEAAWQAAINTSVALLASALRAAGLVCCTNLSDTQTRNAPAWVRRIAGFTPQTNTEFFIAAPTNPQLATADNGLWHQTLDWVDHAEATQTRPIYHAATTEPAVARYALATLLLGWHGRGVFCASHPDRYGDPTNDLWLDDYSIVQQLGPPIAPRRQRDRIWTRRYARGLIEVNPSTSPTGELNATSGRITLTGGDMEPQRWQAKARPVTALPYQWDPDSVASVIEWLRNHDAALTYADTGRDLEILHQQRQIRLPVGHYIMIDDTGRLDTMPADDFETTYTPTESQ